ncbi:MAG TPA: hypothetical protein P5107_05760 [Thermotogota bacterium]|nr:hypothetical protein [Thermotogota bacterium]HRW34538.1 hypothetical protein [Thermotogota bacterium]
MKIVRSIKNILSVVGSYLFIFFLAIISGIAMLIFRKKGKS